MHKAGLFCTWMSPPMRSNGSKPSNEENDVPPRIQGFQVILIRLSKPVKSTIPSSRSSQIPPESLSDSKPSSELSAGRVRSQRLPTSRSDRRARIEEKRGQSRIES